ncbi:MAG: hypothetical protein BWK77_01960 [Verrucomicrobia bacterium A1]|nr:MAG: hypothetical protein BWK77_01960 [Verrucomicrobia bacterium A1]
MTTGTTIRMGVAAAACLAAAGCMTGPPPASVYGVGGDRETVLAVRARLSDDPVLAHRAIGVTASRGIVTLSGSVPAGLRAHALVIASSTPGVRGVEDRLVASPSGMFSTP